MRQSISLVMEVSIVSNMHRMTTHTPIWNTDKS
jgi:hypothetical protein